MVAKVNTDEALEPLVRQLGETLLPLAEILQSVGISHSDVTESFKQAAVAAARRRLAADGVEPTKSRIALICDLPRAEVARLYSAGRSKYEPKLSLGSQILERWSSGKRWLGEAGPLDLPLKGIRSFSELCRSITNRVRPKTILDELEANGNVEITDAGDVRYLNRQAIPSDRLALISTGLNNIRHHLETFLENLRKPKSLYEQFIASDGIPRSRSRAVLRALRPILSEANTRAGAVLEQAEVENIDFDTIGVGLYLYLKPLDEK